MRRLLIPVLTALVVVSVMVYQAAAPAPTLAEPPRLALPDLAGFPATPVPPAAEETGMLPKDTLIEKRSYETGNGCAYLASLVIGGSAKGSIHRPELCLPAQGFLMANPRTRRVGGVDWRLLTLVAKDGGPDASFAYTFVNQAGYRTSSHMRRIFRDVWDRSFLGRIDRWAMVTVAMPGAGEAAAESFLMRLSEGLFK